MAVTQTQAHKTGGDVSLGFKEATDSTYVCFMLPGNIYHIVGESATGPNGTITAPRCSKFYNKTAGTVAEWINTDGGTTWAEIGDVT